jgi:hypothetical protein
VGRMTISGLPWQFEPQKDGTPGGRKEEPKEPTKPESHRGNKTN